MIDFRHLAVCRDYDPEIFFPVGAPQPAMGLPAGPVPNPSRVGTDAAKAICRSCPVVTQCLTWALETGQDAGVWGGLSEDERRELRRRRRNLPPTSGAMSVASRG